MKMTKRDLEDIIISRKITMSDNIIKMLKKDIIKLILN